MLLEYIKLYEEFLEIVKKIIFNPTSVKVKQQLADITNGVIDDAIYVLKDCSHNGYIIHQGIKAEILSQFEDRKRQLYTKIETSGILKQCKKCGKRLPPTPRFFYRDCTAKDGIRNDCIECHKVIQKELYHQKRKSSAGITPIEEEGLIS